MGSFEVKNGESEENCFHICGEIPQDLDDEFNISETMAEYAEEESESESESTKE